MSSAPISWRARIGAAICSLRCHSEAALEYAFSKVVRPKAPKPSLFPECRHQARLPGPKKHMKSQRRQRFCKKEISSIGLARTSAISLRITACAPPGLPPHAPGPATALCLSSWTRNPEPRRPAAQHRSGTLRKPRSRTAEANPILGFIESHLTTPFVVQAARQTAWRLRLDDQTDHKKS